MRGARPAPRGVRVLSRRHMHRFPRTGVPDAPLPTKTKIPQQLFYEASIEDLCKLVLNLYLLSRVNYLSDAR